MNEQQQQLRKEAEEVGGFTGETTAQNHSFRTVWVENATDDGNQSEAE